MKIRTSFVANSSSSSFILLLPGKPETIEELAAMLFGKERRVFHAAWNDEVVSDLDIARMVFCGLEELEEKSVPVLLDSGVPDVDAGRCPNYEHWDEYMVKVQAKAQARFDELRKANPDAKLFTTSADDHGTVEAIVESGQPFDRIPHIRISQH